MKKIIFGLLFFHLISGKIYSQINQQWLERFNGPVNGSDNANAIATDNAGNVFVTGNITDSINRRTDILTIKYSPSGELLWSNAYNGALSGLDYGNDIAVDISGNVYVTGSTAGTSNSNCITIKYDNSGNVLWENVLFNGEGKRIKTDNQGFIYVSGNTSTPTANDLLLIKYDSSGAFIWSDIFNGNSGGPDLGTGLALDNSGNVFICGNEYIGPQYGIRTIKYNPSGTIQWSILYNSPGGVSNLSSDITLDNNGNSYLCGSVDSAGIKNFLTLMYNSSGIFQWVDKYTQSIDGFANRIVSKNGIVYTTGYARSPSFDYDYLTLKYNTTGRIWSRVYGYITGGLDVAYSLTVDNDYNVYVTGTSQGMLGPSQDYATVKYDSAGVRIWDIRYSGSDINVNTAFDITIDNNNNVIVTGSSGNQINPDDYLTIKYSQVTGIYNSGLDFKRSFYLFQNYPNPFNPETKIRFNLNKSSNVSLRIFDATGKVVADLINNKFYTSGDYSVAFNAAQYNLTSGVYFYKLTANSVSDLRKMILVK